MDDNTYNKEVKWFINKYFARIFPTDDFMQMFTFEMIWTYRMYDDESPNIEVYRFIKDIYDKISEKLNNNTYSIKKYKKRKIRQINTELNKCVVTL